MSQVIFLAPLVKHNYRKRMFDGKSDNTFVLLMRWIMYPSMLKLAIINQRNWVQKVYVKIISANCLHRERNRINSVANNFMIHLWRCPTGP